MAGVGRGDPGVFRVKVELSPEDAKDIRKMAKLHKLTMRGYLEKRFHDVDKRDLDTWRGIDLYFW